MENWTWIVGIAVYALIGFVVYWLLGEISGSADMATWKELLWAATWPLIPVYLMVN